MPSGKNSPKDPRDPKNNKEKKTVKVPYHYKPDMMPVDVWQKALRRQFAETQNFTVKNIGNHPVFSDFEVHNPQSGNTYKIAVRSEEIGLNFCTCPDFKINTLGTCKHLEFTLVSLKNIKRNMAFFKTGYQRPYSSVTLRYGEERKVVLRTGTEHAKEITQLSERYFDKDGVLLPDAYDRFEEFLKSALQIDPDFHCYPDATEYIVEVRENHHRQNILAGKYPLGTEDKVFDKLLRTQLFPYQKEGILFAVRTGRSIIADDMGLGKTVQAIGAAELLIRDFGIEKILIVCPTSLKYQWKSEIEKFTDSNVTVIEGLPLLREAQYQDNSIYKIVSYNSVVNDIHVVKKLDLDLVILDEAQRIKNWKTKTSQHVKNIPSRYALVLTGTPLENRIDELHSIVAFVDKYRLGPLFKFLYQHQVVDNSGKVVGYTDLNKVGESIKSILIRRTRKEVLKQLPERMDKNYFVPVTEEQARIHEEYYDMVCRLVKKWRKHKFLSEQDRQRLMIGLNCMRMVSDSTYILDQKTRHDTKIDELMTLLQEIFENREKVVIFSQWERMTRLVANELDALKVSYQYLHGGVPSIKRKDLLTNFREDKDCLVFLSTDAGGVGLNLQSASIIINLDIPWNPAVLEQRIARIHRLGQHKPVNVINFISKGTIEENLLGLLSFKKSVFAGVLDNGDNIVFMGEGKLKQFMNMVAKAVEPAEQTHESLSVEAPVTPPLNPLPTTHCIWPSAAMGTPEGRLEESSILPPPLMGGGEGEGEKGKGEPSLTDLFKTGILFLEKLSHALTDGNSPQTVISSLIEKDKDTGKSFLKIPVPDEDTISQAVSTFGRLLQGLRK